VAQPGFSTGAAVSPPSVARGGETTVTVSVTSGAPATALVDVEIFTTGGQKLLQKWYDGESFSAGQTKQFPVSWQVPANAPTGQHVVKIGVFTPGWGTLHSWNNAAAQVVVTP
jgi:hypothetical protein